MYLLFHLPVIEARGKPRFSCCVLLKWGHFSFIFSCCRKLAFPPLKYKCIFLLLGCFLLKQGFKAEVSGCSANILFSDLYVLSFPIETGFGASWGQILHQSLVKFLGIGCLNWFERGELNVQHPDLAKCMDRGCLSVRKSETTFLAENRIRACLLIQKKVVFVSEIKVWSCSWACKMPGASPSFPGSCNALIHQNQSLSWISHSVPRCIWTNYVLLPARRYLGSGANDGDWLVHRPGCFWAGAGWQQTNCYFVGFCLITCKNRPKHPWWRGSSPSSSDGRERSFQRYIKHCCCWRMG